MIDLSQDVSGMFDGEALSKIDWNSLTELCLDWCISHVILLQMLVVKPFSLDNADTSIKLW